jgi:hypothetical protein
MGKLYHLWFLLCIKNHKFGKGRVREAVRPICDRIIPLFREKALSIPLIIVFFIGKIFPAFPFIYPGSD